MVDRKVVVAAAAKSLLAVAGLDLENDHVWRKCMEIDLYALEHLLKKFALVVCVLVFQKG